MERRLIPLAAIGVAQALACTGGGSPGEPDAPGTIVGDWTLTSVDGQGLTYDYDYTYTDDDCGEVRGIESSTYSGSLSVGSDDSATLTLRVVWSYESTYSACPQYDYSDSGDDTDTYAGQVRGSSNPYQIDLPDFSGDILSCTVSADALDCVGEYDRLEFER